MEQILTILSGHHLLNKVTINVLNDLIYDQRPDQQLFSDSTTSYQIQFSNSVPSQIFQKAQKELNSLNLQIQISKSLEGRKMSTYPDLHQLNSQELVTLSHQQNQVLLVDIWATWCGPCQKPMQHNQQMLLKNQEKWKNKVRIVAVSVDDQKEIIKQRVQSKGWNKIEHLTLLGWQKQHPLIKEFEVQGIPFVFLVNKSGQIDYAGHPMSINLQQRINKLLEQEVKAKVQKNDQTALSAENILSETQKIETLKKQLTKEKLQQKFSKFDLFSLIANGKLTKSQGKYQQNQLVLKLSVYEDSTESINQFKKHLKDIDPQIYQLQENIVKFVVPPEIQNVECSDCKIKLEYPLYWCKWDPNPSIFRCRPCVQKKPTEEGKHYSYLQNSVLLTGAFKRIAVKQLGKNIQPESLQKIEQPLGFSCNGCGLTPSNIGQARYICLGCRSDPNYQGDYVDVCQSCLNNYLEGNKQVREILEADGHKENHPFLRVLYNVEGYFNF